MAQNTENSEKSIPLFVTKLFTLLVDNQHRDIIEWCDELHGLRIKNIKQLEQRVLPKYFRHGNYNSFVRQLNMYDFHKVRLHHEHTVFYHPKFTALERDKLICIKRKNKDYNSSNDPSGSVAPHFSQQPRQRKPITSEETDQNNENQEPFYASTPVLSAKISKKVSFEPPMMFEEPKIQMLIQELVDLVRSKTDCPEEQKKLIYQLKKQSRFMALRGKKNRKQIYRQLSLGGQFSESDLDDLSIEEEIQFDNRVLTVRSIQNLKSENLLRRPMSSVFRLESEGLL